MPDSAFVEPHLKEASDATPPVRQLLRAIERAVCLLPINGPLQFFCHQNSLRGLEEMPWDQAVRRAERLFNGKTCLTENEYQSLRDAGHIQDSDLQAIVWDELGAEATRLVAPGVTLIELRLAMLQSAGSHGRWPVDSVEPAHPLSTVATASVATTCVRPRNAFRASISQDGDALVHEILVPFVASFCDRGQASWQLPQHERGFLNSFVELYGTTGLVTLTWRRGLRDELQRFDDPRFGPLESIANSLSQFHVAEHEREEFLAMTLLTLRGWAGLIRTRNWTPVGDSGSFRPAV